MKKCEAFLAFFNYAFRRVGHEVRNRQPPAVRVAIEVIPFVEALCNISLPQDRGSFADFASVGHQGVDEDAISN